MSSLNNNPFLLASGNPTDPTFPVQRSVRLRSSASAYFNRTPASAPTSYRKTTISFWAKNIHKSDGGYTTIYGQGDYNLGTPAARYGSGIFFVGGQFYVSEYAAGTTRLLRQSNALFRDPSAWYHFVISIDSTLPQGNNQCIVWCNNEQLSWAAATNPTQNTDLQFQASMISYIGASSFTNPASKDRFLDGYITEFYFIDGQALTPASFGSYNAGSGVWQPIRYTGTYGTNGFYLNFQDNSGATATTIGKDSSGNGNNWTPNNISVTAGVTYDSMLDVPTNTSSTNANFPTLNPLFGSSGTLGNANLSLTASAANPQRIGTIGVSSGKWYYEVTLTSLPAGSDPIVGFTDINNTSAVSQYVGQASSSYAIYTISTNSFLQKLNNATFTNTNTGVAAQGNIISVALDLDNNKIWFAKNNVWVDSGDPAAGSNSQFTVTAGTYVPAFRASGGGTSSTIDVNFGQRPFTYTPPTGFKSLNTYNLPEPTIPSGDDFHKVYTYTGNGGGLQVGEIQKPASLFNLDRSLRLRSSASAYLSRTPASITNKKTWTFSAWVKRGTQSTSQNIFTAYVGGTVQYFWIHFYSDNSLYVYGGNNAGGGMIVNMQSTAIYRDPFNWYHVVVKWDTTQATASNRCQVYVNGIELTSFQGGATYPSLNAESYVNSNCIHMLGQSGSSTQYYDGYIADVYLIDGQALTPSDFGAYDGNYYWTPKAYTGTYGTNGFHLEFEDNSAATAAAIGKDTSGNVNNWTPTNISVTAGATYDSMTDVPTLTSTNVANFSVMNPLNNPASATFADGNLKVTNASADYRGSLSTISIPANGKFYWEFQCTTNPSASSIINIGIAPFGIPLSGNQAGYTNSAAWYAGNATYWISGGTSIGTSTTSNVFQVAYDASNGKVWLGRDNVWYWGNTTTNNTTGDPSAGTNQTFTLTTATEFYAWMFAYANGATVNFGQRPFSYTPPTGFKSINSFNIAEVTTDLETPDFVWIKSRSATTGHALFNSVTGVNKYLSSNATTAETTDVNSLIQFNKNGFLLGNAAIVNTSAATYVASAWKGGGAAVTNTAGSITSQVSANQKAGFSIVTYTGTGANATVGHGLGIAPKMVIVKSRNNVGSIGYWAVWHTSIPNTDYLLLQTTDAKATSSLYWNSTSPTSTVFSLGAGTTPNASTSTYVAYCFSEIAGFSKFGSYTGTGNTDGQFIYTGFRPRLIITKQTGAISNWSIHDSTRAPYNLTINELYADTSDVEYTGTNDSFDLLSNGFKPRSAGTPTNASGGTYIYIAFAENPFKYSLAR